MDAYSPLRDLLEALEQGNRYHISIEFFNKALATRLQVPRRHIIHATAFCDAVKMRPSGLDRCIRCKGRAMDKCRKTGAPFGGLCVNGAYEYCYPVFRNSSLICIIFLGNIIQDRDLFLERSGLTENDPLLETMQQGMDEESCQKICAVLASYILMLLDSLPDSPQEKRVNATISAVKGYVDCYFFHDVTLSNLARMYHYNEKYLGTLFKKQMGISFHDYLNERRLRNAKVLLKETRESILDVAAKSGFNNVTYFNRLFKTKYGVTPSQYRAKIQKK